MKDVETVELLAQWREGSEEAAAELYRRYAGRLVGLVCRRMSAKLGRRLDPEDVIQSAYRAFFAGARADRYVLRQTGDLWSLLARITLNKLLKQIDRHTAARRALDRERDCGDDGSQFGRDGQVAGPHAPPPEVVALEDLVERVSREFRPVERQVFDMKLAGYRLEEIARATGRCCRTVRRVLDEKIKPRLEQLGLPEAGS